MTAYLYQIAGSDVVIPLPYIIEPTLWDKIIDACQIAPFPVKTLWVSAMPAISGGSMVDSYTVGFVVNPPTYPSVYYVTILFRVFGLSLDHYLFDPLGYSTEDDKLAPLYVPSKEGQHHWAFCLPNENIGQEASSLSSVLIPDASSYQITESVTQTSISLQGIPDFDALDTEIEILKNQMYDLNKWKDEVEGKALAWSQQLQEIQGSVSAAPVGLGAVYTLWIKDQKSGQSEGVKVAANGPGDIYKVVSMLHDLYVSWANGEADGAKIALSVTTPTGKMYSQTCTATKESIPPVLEAFYEKLPEKLA